VDGLEPRGWRARETWSGCVCGAADPCVFVAPSGRGVAPGTWPVGSSVADADSFGWDRDGVQRLAAEADDLDEYGVVIDADDSASVSAGHAPTGSSSTTVSCYSIARLTEAIVLSVDRRP
jgi:hypothetical protein